MAQHGGCNVIRKACDYWTDSNYCGGQKRRYMNEWRCIKHTPAAIRRAEHERTS